MNILAVGAHPDDVELGCFGTLLEVKSRGGNAYAAALCPGSYGGHSWSEIETVWSEARKLLREGKGRGDYVLGSFPIGKIQHDWQTVRFVDELIEKLEVDTVITHHYGEAHQDHLTTQKIAVSSARRRVDNLLLWESSIYTHRNVFPFRPQLYFPISRESHEGKMRILDAYLSAGLLEEQEAQAHRHLAQYRGAEMRREFAEAYEVVWEVRHR